jgi:hypothetical protein
MFKVLTLGVIGTMLVALAGCGGSEPTSSGASDLTQTVPGQPAQPSGGAAPGAATPAQQQSAVWPSDAKMLVVESTGNAFFSFPLPPGSNCAPGAQKYTLDLATKTLTFATCKTAGGSAPFLNVTGSKAMTADDLAAVDAAMKGVVVSQDLQCLQDIGIVSVTITSASGGSKTFLDSVAGCPGQAGPFLGNLDPVFTAFEHVVDAVPPSGTLWPADVQKLVVETTSGGIAPAPSGSQCAGGEANFSLDVATKTLTSRFCKIVSFTQPFTLVSNTKVLTDAQMASLKQTISGLAPSNEHMCLTDGGNAQITVTSSALGERIFKDVESCAEPGPYVDLGATLTTLRSIADG